MGRLVEETCCKCGTRFAMAPEVYHTAKARREEFSFYCPNGHAQHYVTGKTDKERLQEELSQARQEAAHLEDEAKYQRDRAKVAERSAAAYKGVATRARNRIKNGVCPCCNRTFQNLAAHMASQHPEFGSGEDIERAREGADS